MPRKNAYKSSCLSPLKGKIIKYKFVGFDVETVNDVFYSGGLYWFDEYGNEQFFYTTDKRELINKILNPYFADYRIIATNLGYDFNSLFYDEPEWNDFNSIIMKNSRIMFADWRPKNNRLVYGDKRSAKKGRILFYDTLNYAQMSVESLGKIVGVPKMKAPSFLGKRAPIRYGENKEYEYFQETIKEDVDFKDKYSRITDEYEYLKEYNKRDCIISYMFAELFQKGVNDLGGKMQMTAASTSMDLYRRRYMDREIIKEKYVLKDDSINDFIYSGYYGGRTEVFARGYFSRETTDGQLLNYYDVNSLYPYVMQNQLPVPQSVKTIKKFDVSLIGRYMGVTTCEVTVPNMMYPPLPFKGDKLIFPTGTFTGTWNNNELSYAMNQGVKINKIFKQIIYQETHTPFKNYVNDLYEKRLMYKKQNSSYEVIIKLMLNSLYGKFAMKHISEYRVFTWEGVQDEWAKIYIDENHKGWKIDEIDDKIIFRKDRICDAVFVFPIYSSYITSYARIHLHKLLVESDAVYCDTDSIITKKYMTVSVGLGGLKCEGSGEDCFIVKPKFYYYGDDVKIKGLSKTVDDDGKIIKTSKKEFNQLIKGDIINKKRFSGLKESVRRRIKPNTSIITPKEMDIKDTKRVWSDYFNLESIEYSEALRI
jgi:hypothetical protein